MKKKKKIEKVKNSGDTSTSPKCFISAIFQTSLQETFRVDTLKYLGGNSNNGASSFFLALAIIHMFFFLFFFFYYFSNICHLVNIGYVAFQEDSSAGDDSVHDRFIGPLPREGSVGSTNDYVSQSYSYSSILNKSETGKICLCCIFMNCRHQPRVILAVSSLIPSFCGLENLRPRARSVVSRSKGRLRMWFPFSSTCCFYRILTATIQ